MAVVINTNVDSIKIRHDLASATSLMSQKMERMSTGLKVLSAKDDAAGNVIAARMTVQMDGNKIAQQNVQNGNAMLATAEGHLNVVEDNLSRIRDLTLQAKNGTYSAEEIQAMQDEIAELKEEIDRVSKSSKYSSLQLFEEATPDVPSSLQKVGCTFQVGANSSEDNTILASSDLFQSVQFSALTGIGNGEAAKAMKDNGKAKLEKDYLDLTELTKEEMADAIDALDTALDNITGRKSIIGSAENRLDSALKTLETQYENLSSAKSIIMDADIAEEASEFTQQSILQQVSTSLLAQANQAPAIALSLI